MQKSEKGIDVKGPQILIIAPTRELAIQSKDVIDRLQNSKDEFKLSCLYGGKNMFEQKRQLYQNPNIVIGTPGRIKAMIESDLFKVENLSTLILDEADVLLDFGFDKDILAINDLIKSKSTKDL